MQSKSFSFRQSFRKIFASSRDKWSAPTGDTAPVPSGSIGGRTVVATTAIQTSLALLKEGSALATNVPFIGPIAGLLLLALQMRGEVKQFKGDWEAVMQKLTSVANIVVNVGESCQTHNLKEEDLPAGLRTILLSIRTELDGIEAALKECAETGRIKKVILRADMLQTVKQYDSKLSNVLQTFQAKMALDSRFAQIVMERNVAVTNATPTEVTSMPTGPRTPQIFFGRDAELAQIIHMIFTNIGSHPARIAILGPGGYGKTTLSNAVLTHDRVREHYGAARYFVACESISSSGALLIEIGKVLGVLKGPSDSLWSRIRTSLEAKECIICFDNFETPWDQAGDTRHSVEGILSGVTELGRVTVLITMRGTERPSETQWTKPPLAPLQTLNYHAAKEIWMHIADIYDDHAEELIKAVDYVPLAVNLLAHLSQVTPPALLWKDWNSRQTRVVQRGQAHRLSNLEYSIQLSIDSGRMMANPRAKDLLGVLSMLPDGMHIQKLDKFHEILGDIEITTCLQVLQQCGLINLSGERYHPHPIIRHFCNHHGLISPKYKGSLEDFYLTLASISLWHAEPQQYAEMVLEVNNTKAVLLGLIESNYEDHQRIINAIIPFTELHRNIGDLSDKLISQVVQFLQQNHGTASSLIMCFRAWSLLYVYADDLNIATQKLKEAERICLSHGNTYDLSYASILNDLGDIYFAQGASNEAEGLFQKALKLWEAANNISGQGESHEKLGGIYLQMRNYSEAEASFQKALNFSKAADDILCQSRVYSGLADTYVQLGKLDEAEGTYQQALEIDKAINSVIGQGNDYSRLGDIYLRQNKLAKAESSLQLALDLYKLANNILGQGACHCTLGETYLEQHKLEEASASFKKAYELYKAANNGSGVGYALNGLGMLYIEKSELMKAKDMFEEAIGAYHQGQHKEGEEQSKKRLDKVLFMMEKGK